jgi:pimeloyl-ACP methyl ester carboxylesterase
VYRIMAGAEDRVINANQPGRLHTQIPHSILRMVPGVGHMIHYAVPEEVAEAIEESRRNSDDARQRSASSYPAAA